MSASYENLSAQLLISNFFSQFTKSNQNHFNNSVLRHSTEEILRTSAPTPQEKPKNTNDFGYGDLEFSQSNPGKSFLA